MPTHTEVARTLYAALEREPDVNLHRFPIALQWRDDDLVLDGEVENIIAKKRVLRCVAKLNGAHRVVDRLHVAQPQQSADGVIRDSVAAHLQQEPVFRRCTLRLCNGNGAETLTLAVGALDGEIDVMVDAGVVTLTGAVISLSHRRLAGVLAWWAPGCRDVVNNLQVVPAQIDNDDEISDALRIVLEKDPLVHAGQIGIRTIAATVTLAGLVATEVERHMAELDAWYVLGVREVINRIRIGRVVAGTL
jgi:osmotically-inducible protein OsmY